MGPSSRVLQAAARRMRLPYLRHVPRAFGGLAVSHLCAKGEGAERGCGVAAARGGAGRRGATHQRFLDLIREGAVRLEIVGEIAGEVLYLRLVDPDAAPDEAEQRLQQAQP